MEVGVSLGRQVQQSIVLYLEESVDNSRVPRILSRKRTPTNLSIYAYSSIVRRAPQPMGFQNSANPAAQNMMPLLSHSSTSSARQSSHHSQFSRSEPLARRSLLAATHKHTARVLDPKREPIRSAGRTTGSPFPNSNDHQLDSPILPSEYSCSTSSGGYLPSVEALPLLTTGLKLVFGQPFRAKARDPMHVCTAAVWATCHRIQTRMIRTLSSTPSLDRSRRQVRLLHGPHARIRCAAERGHKQQQEGVTHRPLLCGDAERAQGGARGWKRNTYPGGTRCARSYPAGTAGGLFTLCCTAKRIPCVFCPPVTPLFVLFSVYTVATAHIFRFWIPHYCHVVLGCEKRRCGSTSK